MIKQFWMKIYLLFTVLMGTAIANEENSTRLGFDSEVFGSAKVLSRKRRFLIFPDGSSFQLVFCAQNQGYLQVGDIVWFGNTAALAWELPTDPNVYQFFINSEKKFFEGNRRQDTKHIIYFNEDGKVLSKVPYHRKFIVNPAFAKRSVATVEESNIVKPISRKSMHDAHINRNLIQELDRMSIRFHREGRKSLYAKLEKMLEGLGLSGKECLLRLLCENAKIKKTQGTFLQEIMKATFMFPQSADDFHKKYDLDLSPAKDCMAMYPECENLDGFLFQ